MSESFRIMRTSMKLWISMLMLCCFMQFMHSQSNSTYRIKRSNLGSSGSSHTFSTNQGTYRISQSVGQSSVIGTYHNNGYYLRQGYQQPEVRVQWTNEIDLELKAVVYPNPFSYDIFVSFDNAVHDDIFVEIMDVNARIIHRQKFAPSQIIELQLPTISSGTYFLKVISKGKIFNAKLIKI